MRLKTIPKNDVEFLKAFLQEIQRGEETAQHVSPEDLVPPPEGTLPTVNEETERVAQLADEYGFDGSLFREFELMPFEDKLSLRWFRSLRKQRQAIYRIIAAIKKPVDRSVIPDGVELLTVPQVARMLGWKEGTVRDKNNKGLLPMPIRIDGMIQWPRKEIKDWIAQGCPPRQKWEQMKKVGGGD